MILISEINCPSSLFDSDARLGFNLSQELVCNYFHSDLCELAYTQLRMSNVKYFDDVPVTLISQVLDHVYVQITNQLSVNDIINLNRSGLDDRTRLAFTNLRHVRIMKIKIPLLTSSNKSTAKLTNHQVDYRMINDDDFQRIFQIVGLCPSMKTIDIFDVNGRKLDRHHGLLIYPEFYQQLGEKCPNLRHLTNLCEMTLSKYLVGLQNRQCLQTKLTKLSLNLWSISIDNLCRILSLSPFLESVKLKRLSAAIGKVDQLLVEFVKLDKIQRLSLESIGPQLSIYAFVIELVNSIPKLRHLSLKHIHKYSSELSDFALQQFFDQLSMSTFDVSINFDSRLQHHIQDKSILTGLRLNNGRHPLVDTNLQAFVKLRYLSVNFLLIRQTNQSSILSTLIDKTLLTNLERIKLVNVWCTSQSQKSLHELLHLRGKSIVKLSVIIEIDESILVNKIIDTCQHLDSLELYLNSKVNTNQIGLNELCRLSKSTVDKPIRLIVTKSRRQHLLDLSRLAKSKIDYFKSDLYIV